MMAVREKSTDRQGRPLTPGARVRVLAEQGNPEASVVRVLDDYEVVTVQFEKPTKVERMYKTSEVEVV
ncbi:MAG: hypothetical protein AUH31_09110 [Armatimonadetes bacterium 13_1_40CM_64_14]|nr:MAG: hypothetical protein AUH31_09110 [Armatimonadetes bacterium 13_1_40CM_64_14]